MLEEMTFNDDYAYYEYLPVTFGYQSAFSKHRDSIKTGVEKYNAAIKTTENDADEEDALEHEREKAEAKLSGKTKDYAGMDSIVSGWGILLSAINRLDAARRNFKKRTPVFEMNTEKQYDEKVDLVAVPNGSDSGEFTTGKQDVDQIAREYDQAGRKGGTDAFGKLAKPYQELKYFKALKQTASSGAGQDGKATAQKSLIEVAETLKDYQTAVQNIGEANQKKPSLHAAVQPLIEALCEKLPGTINGPEDVTAEAQRIGKASTIPSALTVAESYTKVRDEVDKLWEPSKPKNLNKAHTGATSAPTEVSDLAAKTRLLQELLPDLRAVAFRSKLGSVQTAFDKSKDLEPKIDSKGHEEFATRMTDAKDSFEKGETEKAQQLLEAIEKEVTKRRVDALGGLVGKAQETIADLEKEDPSIGDVARDVLTKLRGKLQIGSKGEVVLPAVTEASDPEAVSRNLRPIDLIGDLMEPARRYTAALELAQARRKAGTPPGFAKPFAEVTALKLPSDQSLITAKFFDGPAGTLEKFNRDWAIAAKFDREQRRVDVDLRTLESSYKAKRNRPQEEIKENTKTIQGFRKDLNSLKKDALELKLDQATKGLQKLDQAIDHAMDALLVEAKAAAQTLGDGNEGRKSVLDRIDSTEDGKGHDLTAVLYRSFGEGLGDLLDGLNGSSPPEENTDKSVRTLVAFSQTIGVKALRDLGTEVCDGDPKKLGALIADLMEKRSERRLDRNRRQADRESGEARRRVQGQHAVVRAARWIGVGRQRPGRQTHGCVGEEILRQRCRQTEDAVLRRVVEGSRRPSRHDPGRDDVPARCHARQRGSDHGPRQDQEPALRSGAHQAFPEPA